MSLFGRSGKDARSGDERAEPKLFSDRRSSWRRDRGLREERGSRPVIFTVLSWIMTLGLWGTLVAAAVVGYAFLSLDKQGLFKIPEREPGMILLADDGNVLAERGSFFGDEVRLDELPAYVPQAVIAIEDRRFYQHFGIDLLGLLRAGLANLHAGHIVEGGSTITQQLAKNLFLQPDRTIERKFQEAILALWLESKFSKDEILQLYLNRVYYGAGSVGIERAAQRFFARSARDVNLAQAAILASVLKAPSAYNPITHPDRATARARLVIANMVDAGFITKSEADRAASLKTTVKVSNYLPATQYIVDFVSEQLPDLVGKVSQSIVVETTIDRKLQAAAERSVRRHLEHEGAKLNVSEAAVVTMNGLGEIKAMVGGRSYVKSQFNRAVKAKRQPGSAFKAFVYLTAIEQGATPDSIEIDEPVQIGNWSPENYRRQYLGPVSLTRALALSLNTVAAKVAQAAGPENVAATAKRLGILSPLQANASIALGTSEVTLLELASAHVPFSNGGFAVIPHVVSRITTRDGKVLYERHGGGPGKVIGNFELGAMNTMLREVVTNGTGRRAALPDHDVAGKTGTSQDYRDAWYIGYSAQYLTGVWVGNDDNSPTKKVTGGSIPAAIWVDIMAPLHANLPSVPLPGEYRPSGPGVEVPMAQGERGIGGFFEALENLFGGRARSAPRREPVYPPDSDLSNDRDYPLTEAQRRERLRQRREMLDEMD
ncbi:MAG TPA: PBP1A family penicillin-binding protein [Aestuariivirgaceae bacterium]|jgi:penicillin-binding protein 1A|nr:PBP1A family penicillin-binding protein [Aestuariivirgaceae bacterium]